MKKILTFSLISILITIAAYYAVPKAQGGSLPYYTGEAINFNNRVIFGTGTVRGAEIFELAGNNIIRKLVIRSDDPTEQKIHDNVFNEESGRLFVYLTNGQSIFKYDITDLPQYYLVKKVKDNSKDYFYGLGKADGGIFSVGTKNIKVWNTDLAVTNTYTFNHKHAKGMAFSENGNFVFNTNNREMVAYDAFYRNEITSAPLASVQDHAMHPYIDEERGLVYVADDNALNKFYIDGRREGFNHTSDIGYDVDGIDGSGYVYFSDGIGVVKVRTSDMKPVDWVYTTALGGANGWAMGLRAVRHNGGDIVIVYNGNSILAFDGNLNLIDDFRSLDTSEDRIATVEPLSLSVDTRVAFPDDTIRLEGRGFGIDEALRIDFAGRIFYTRAGQDGRFSTTVNVPCSKAGITDIKVTGEISKLTYSTTFKIR